MKTIKLLSFAIVILLIIPSCSDDGGGTEENTPVTQEPFAVPKSETFTFSSNGIDIIGKIYLPDAYETNNNLPVIYLLDYQEQHFQVAKDETLQVLYGVDKINGLDALVATLKVHQNIDSKAETFNNHYAIFKDMAKYVDANYSKNTSRTFIGRGSEGGVVLLALLSEPQATSVFTNFIATDSPASFNDPVIDLIKNDKVPKDLEAKKLHFSFSSTNDRGNCLQLINSFKDAQYSWLTFNSIEYSSHYETTYPTAFADGLKFVFEE